MGTTLYIPTYPSADAGGIKPAFRQNIGGGGSVFEAFTIDFTDMTVGNAPSDGGQVMNDSEDIPPTISSDMTDDTSDVLTPTIENRTLFFEHSLTPNHNTWGWSLANLGGGASTPVEGFRFEMYVWGDPSSGGDSRFAVIPWVYAMSPALWDEMTGPKMWNWYQAAPDPDGTRFRAECYTDHVSEGLTESNVLGTIQTNYHCHIKSEVNWTTRVATEYVRNLNTGVSAVSGNMTLPTEEDFPAPRFSHMGIWGYRDEGKPSFRIQSIWMGKLTDDYPTPRGRS